MIQDVILSENLKLLNLQITTKVAVYGEEEELRDNKFNKSVFKIKFDNQVSRWRLSLNSTSSTVACFDSLSFMTIKFEKF